MEDRKRRFDDKTEVRGKIADALKQGAGTQRSSTASISSPPTPTCQTIARCGLSSSRRRAGIRGRNRGWRSRPRWNVCGTTAPSRGIAQIGLLFLAADHGTLSRLNDAARVALAWGSIVDDVKEGASTSTCCKRSRPRRSYRPPRKCSRVRPASATGGWYVRFRRLRPTPSQQSKLSRSTRPGVPSGVRSSACALKTSWSSRLGRPSICGRSSKSCTGRKARPAAGAMAFWEDTLRYLYLPRLKDSRRTCAGDPQRRGQSRLLWDGLWPARRQLRRASISVAKTFSLTIHCC